MRQQSPYSASRAADVVLVLAIAGAILCGWAGVLSIREGSSVGWILVGLGILALVSAILVRMRVR